MSVGRNHARRIASLARLRFGDEELTRITGELNHILDHMEALRTLAGAEGTDAGAEAQVSVRGPAAEEPDELTSDIGAIAPDWRDGFFVVPPLPGMHGGEDE